MKKVLLILLLFMLVTINIFPVETDRVFTLQASPVLYVADLFLLKGDAQDFYSFIMDLEGQYKINEFFNVSLVTAFYIYYNNVGICSEKTTQLLFKPMFIYRPLKTGIKGFYLGFNPIIGWFENDWRLFSIPFVNEYISQAIIGLGFNSGYKWVYKKGFTLQLGGGISKTWNLPKTALKKFYYFAFNADGSFKLRNYDLLAELKLGYSF